MVGIRDRVGVRDCVGVTLAVLHHTTVFTAELSGHFRDGSPFYRGCVRVERREQAPALHY